MNPKINVLIGTKAEMIKVAPVLKEFDRRGVVYHLIETGQHGAYLSKLREELDIREPDVRMGSHSDVDTLFEVFKWSCLLFLTLMSRKRVEKIFSTRQGICLLHGDTPSTFFGVLYAKRAGFQIAHLESGLRSGNFLHPFPEELIRVLVMKSSDVLFAPDEKATSNLLALKVKGRVEETSFNTGIESLEEYIKEVKKNSGPVVATLHRVENLHSKKRFNGFLELLESIVSNRQEVLFVTHQPTEEIIKKYGVRDKIEKSGIRTVPLLPYSDFVKRLANAPYVITDGGSIQEETAHLGVPCLLWRKRTERQNGLERNVVISNYDKRIVNNFLTDFESYRFEAENWDASPSSRVVDVLNEIIGEN
ncbi:MAG: UDP-N-acetylglucosamine 2-epimerase [Acidimicrobiales bacterium]|jgi:UDP-N-acetylglucosamine 2-epimerase (non-hydrolysing)|nr:UDP-N-acetylglucosamine 2-epimerase [Acidimicrobiales bacterium]